MTRGLPNVYDEIFQYAKTYIIERSVYSPKVLKDTPPDIKFPLVIIKQTKDSIYDENLNKTDQRYNLAFEIEIYTKNDKKITKQIIADELQNLINDVFDVHYGMNRRTNRQLPNIDTDVYRWGMKYTAKIDEFKRIYRR